jgi:hypothetical protein
MAGGGKPHLRQDIQDTIKTIKTIETLKYTAFKKMTKICFKYSTHLTKFSGTHPTKTPSPIVLKFRTVDYVGETTKRAKNG